MAEAGKINAYTCDECARKTFTIDRDDGVTPFMIRCVHCGARAMSAFYRVAQTYKPSHEWYRPNDTEITAMAAYPELASTVQHIKDGGLVLRQIGGPLWLDSWLERTGAVHRPEPEARLMNDDPGPRLVVTGCDRCDHYVITLWETARFEGSCTGVFGDHDSASEALSEACFWGNIIGIPVEIEDDIVSLVADGDIIVRGRDGEVYVGPGAGGDGGTARTSGVCGGGDRVPVEPRGSSDAQDQAEAADAVPPDQGCSGSEEPAGPSSDQ
jgi:hypothetical protein